MKKAFIIFLLFLSSQEIIAASLKVSPGGFIVHDIKPGVTYNLREMTGIKLSIYNDDETTHTYELSANKPSEAGRWERGYSEIPDPSWCWFETKEVTISPRKVGYGNVFFRIPDKGEYYNQHWVAALGIMGKQEKGIGFGLGIYVRIQIETESKKDVKQKPWGLLGIVPGTLTFDNISPGSKQIARAIIYNNDDIAHTYTIKDIREIKGLKGDDYRTRSYELVSGPGWIVPDKDQVKIPSGDTGVLSVRLNIPEEASLKNREEILFVIPEEGRPGFIRVRINMIP